MARLSLRKIPMLLLCGLLVSGCTFIKQVTHPTGDVESYLAYFRYASNLSNDDLKKEYNAVSQVYGKSRSDDSRMQLALLLSLPGASFRDDARAQSLLKEVIANKANDDSPLKDFALLLSTQIVEHRKQEEKTKTEQARAEELEQKLEALKSIERSIIERQQTQPVKKK